MSDDTVWQFWEGPVPAYIDLCLETVRAHAPQVRCLDGAAFAELRTEPEIDLTRLMVQHQADYIRAYLLNTYGGMWLDADCVVFADLQPYLDALRVSDYIGYRDNFDGIQSGLMVSRAGGRIIGLHYAKVVDFLASGQELQWLSIGQWPLDNALVEVSWQGYLQLDRRTIAPIGWEQTEAFFVERTDERARRALRRRGALLHAVQLDGPRVVPLSQPRRGADRSHLPLLPPAAGAPVTVTACAPKLQGPSETVRLSGRCDAGDQVRPGVPLGRRS